MKHTDKVTINEINKLGKNANPPFICINPNNGISKDKRRLVSIRCITTREIKHGILLKNLKKGCNPFYRGKAKDLLVEQCINKLGRKSNPQYICINSNYSKDKRGERLVSIQCVKTKEIKDGIYFSYLKKIKNPFSKGKTKDLLIEQEINKLGIKSHHQYICVNPNYGRDKFKGLLGSIQCLKTKEIKSGVLYSNLKKGLQPFYIGKAKNLLIEKDINKLGLKSNPKFKCINPEAGRNKKGFFK